MKRTFRPFQQGPAGVKRTERPFQLFLFCVCVCLFLVFLLFFLYVHAAACKRGWCYAIILRRAATPPPPRTLHARMLCFLYLCNRIFVKRTFRPFQQGDTDVPSVSKFSCFFTFFFSLMCLYICERAGAAWQNTTHSVCVCARTCTLPCAV